MKQEAIHQETVHKEKDPIPSLDTDTRGFCHWHR